MYIVAMVILWDVVIGLAMYLYLLMEWNSYKRMIEKRGWNLTWANPTMLRDAWHYFVPVFGIGLYLIAGSVLEEMAFTNKRDCNGRITVRVLNFDATYQEPIALD